MKRALFVVGVIVALVIAWFLASPLFIDRTVDEDLELFLADGSPNMDALSQLPAETLDGMQQEIMSAASSMPDATVTDDMPAQSPELIASGAFTDADDIHRGSGEALLYRLSDGSHLLRFENFRTTNGPDLVVYLAAHASPATADDVTDAGSLSLGKLKGNVGNQNYLIPANVDIGAYQSAVIWCELFGVLFSPAPLQPVTPDGDKFQEPS
jgi:hypothetical protein